MKFLIKLVAISLLLSLPLIAKSVATLTALKGNVSIENSSGNVNAVLGAQLEVKDSVITADRSKAQLIFKDETIVTIGKNSNFSIQEYLYEQGKEPKVSFGLLKGAMSTITGKIGKIAPEKFVVKTKTATIGIRGTNFTVLALEDGSQRAYCTYGAISVEIGGKTYIVEQGYYLSVSPDGEVKVQAFSPDELANMKNDNFGERESLKGQVSKDGIEIQSSVLLDNTRDAIDSLVIKDITEEMQDAVQTLAQTEPENGGVIGTAILTGYIANNNPNEELSTMNSSSVIETEAYDNTIWTYTLGTTDGILSANFTTTFLGTTSDSMYNSNYFPNPQNNIFTSEADLDPNDEMSWGTWGLLTNYDSYGYPTSRDVSGYWITGELTDTSVIVDYRNAGQVSIYSGNYKAYDLTATPMQITGNASMNVDFGAGTAVLEIMNPGASPTGGVWESYNMIGLTDNSNQLNGASSIVSSNGGASGSFYGPQGNSFGGNFSISDQQLGTIAKGVYELKAQ